MNKEHRLKSSWRFFTVVVVVASLLAIGPVTAPRDSPAQSPCWETEYGGIKFCRGKVSFDGGGDFAGTINRRRFLQFAATGRPLEFGFLRSEGHCGGGAAIVCIRTGRKAIGPSGVARMDRLVWHEWTVWCGTKTAHANTGERMGFQLLLGELTDLDLKRPCTGHP